MGPADLQPRDPAAFAHELRADDLALDPQRHPVLRHLLAVIGIRRYPVFVTVGPCTSLVTARWPTPGVVAAEA